MLEEQGSYYAGVLNEMRGDQDFLTFVSLSSGAAQEVMDTDAVTP